MDHPVGEVKNENISHDKVSAGASALPVDTGGGRYHVQWDDSAPVTRKRCAEHPLL